MNGLLPRAAPARSTLATLVRRASDIIDSFLPENGEDDTFILHRHDEDTMTFLQSGD